MVFFHPRWPVFHEDNHLLVIYKPAGLVAQRDFKNKANVLDLVKWWLKKRYGKPGKVYAGLVHRLDATTAGIMVVARTSKAAARVSAQFRDGQVAKTYLAVVQGHPVSPTGRLEHWLVRQGRLSQVVTQPASGGQAAALRYRRIAAKRGRSLLEIFLETGRRHQIRVQLAATGCPIHGDIAYGAGSPMPYGRIALLAHKLSLDHPTQGIRLNFGCPPPKEWPWSTQSPDDERPLWSIEDFANSAQGLPFDPSINPVF